MVRWLAATALLNRPRLRRPHVPHWLPAALSLATMLAGFVVVTLSVGVPAAAGWVALGISIVVAAAGVALGTIGARRSRVLAVVGGGLTALAVWTVVASAGVFEPDTVRWIVLGSGLGYVLESLVALVAHELAPSRVVHVLEVRDGAARS